MTFWQPGNVQCLDGPKFMHIKLCTAPETHTPCGTAGGVC